MPDLTQIARPLSQLVNQYLSSVTPDERQAAIAFLDRIFTHSPLQKASEPPRMFGVSAPDGVVGPVDGYRDDPQAQIAAESLLAQYPSAASGVSNVHVGALGLGADTLGLTFKDQLRKGYGVSLGARSNPDNMGVWDTMRHELSHVLGLPDQSGPATPNAYDVSNASRVLHKDIQLTPYLSLAEALALAQRRR